MRSSPEFGGVRRKLLIALALVVLLVVAVPVVAPPFARKAIITRLEQDLDAKASLEEQAADDRVGNIASPLNPRRIQLVLEKVVPTMDASTKREED